MDIAIVTGAETPLGQQITERLITQGYRVHGIGNNFSKVAIASADFKAHAVDLTDLDAVRTATQAILETEKRLHLLIHAIDVTPGTAFRKLPIGNLEAILKIGLLGPVMLTRMVLPNLMRFRGQLINIIPTNKSGHPASAVNALIEGGLREMNNALFDQARDSGLRITNLLLRQNVESAPENASDAQLIQSRIDPDDVANVIEQLLDAHATNIPNEITLHPQLSASASSSLPEAPEPLDPYTTVVLPPQDYFPPEPELIATKEPDSIQRVIPYTDDEMEEMVAAALEEYEASPERYKEAVRAEDASGQPDGQSGTKKKRRRRRGGRNRNKNRSEQSDESPADTEASSSTTKESESPSPKKESPSSDKVISKPHSKQRRSDRHQDRKPGRSSETVESKAEKQSDTTEATDGTRKKRRHSVRAKLESEDRQEKSSTPESQTVRTAESATEQKPAAKKATKKKTAKKAAKKKAKPVAKSEEAAVPVAAPKAAKKKAAKKKTAKKVAKKAAKKKTAVKKAAKKATKTTDD